jgi:hypothetical protein
VEAWNETKPHVSSSAIARNNFFVVKVESGEGRVCSRT